MSTAPAADQRRLLDVQALDNRLAQLVHQRKTLPVLADLAELAARSHDLGRAEVAARTQVSDVGRELAKAEGDVEQVRERARRDQARLDSGGVSARDAQALTSELESLGARQAALEEVELEIMERLEQAESDLAAIQSQQRAIGADVTRLEVERDASLAQIDEAAQTTSQQRAVAAEGLDAGLLALYERIRAQTGGLAVVALRGRRTEPVSLDLSLTELAEIGAAKPDEVIRSEEYGYILVRLAPGE